MEHPAFRQLTVSVRQAIDAGRVGIPSVVRWYVRTNGGTAGPEDTARSMLNSASNWLGGEPADARACGSLGGTEAVVHATWPAGAVAMLTASHGEGEPANDLILLGSRGAIYFGRTPDGVTV